MLRTDEDDDRLHIIELLRACATTRLLRCRAGLPERVASELRHAVSMGGSSVARREFQAICLRPAADATGRGARRSKPRHRAWRPVARATRQGIIGFALVDEGVSLEDERKRRAAEKRDAAAGGRRGRARGGGRRRAAAAATANAGRARGDGDDEDDAPELAPSRAALPSHARGPRGASRARETRSTACAS